MRREKREKSFTAQAWFPGNPIGTLRYRSQVVNQHGLAAPPLVIRRLQR